jgi:dephospho-CoA kinase
MIIGITGTDGAGKGMVVDYLVKEKGFIHFSSREQITKEIERRNLVANRDTLRLIGNDMRKNEGNDVLVARAITQIQQEHIDFAVIESVRATAEAETLKQAGWILIAIDADQKLRYERIVTRASLTDQISFETFMEQEAIEMNDPDPNGMQKAKVMEMANFTIMNNGSLEEVYGQLEVILEQLQQAR